MVALFATPVCSFVTTTVALAMGALRLIRDIAIDGSGDCLPICDADAKTNRQEANEDYSKHG